ncbi:MAG TPA: GatB/YqeY domain-containing protein [Anaerolineae bacterium]|nr:GatB/YqeY domain-containing protein [Anaerolineae bacterium]
MGLQEQLTQDLKEAMRAGDQARKLAIRSVKTAIRNAEVEKGGALTEQEVQAIIARQIKMRRDAIEQFRQGGREDLVAQEQAELDALRAYLPRQLTRDEIAERARAIIEQVGAQGQQDMGKVMKPLMAELRGQADGRLVSQVVRELLG